MNWYIEVLKKYAVFAGRAHRTEFWMFTLVNYVIIIVLGIIETAVGLVGVLTTVYVLAVLLPNLGVTVRRLHDTDRSGWWILIGLIPVIGWLVLLIFMVLDSTEGDNQYGPNPKLQPQS